MSLKKKQKIVLILSKPEYAIKFFSTNTSNELDYWIYLGKNVIVFSEIEKVIGNRIKRIDTGKDLQDAARTLRKPYIDFVGSLSRNENKMAWILTSISEKNVYLSDLFLMLCYLETLDHEIKKYPGGICVFCEEPVLIRAILKNFEKYANLEIQCFNSTATTIQESIQKKLTLHKDQALFIICYFLRISCARILHILNISGQNIQKNKPVIAIHTWIDKRSFSNINSYSDVHFGNLGHLLEMNNKDFFYMFDILTLTELPRILINMSKVKISWKLFEDFLEFSDIFRAFYMAKRRKKEGKNDVFFSGREVSVLLNAGYAQDKYSLRPELSYLYYFAAKNMTRQFSVKTFIYTFENHIWEKMTIEGIRESSPHTKIVGYAHGTVDKMYLGYSLSVTEKNLIPTPDVILVNGHQAQEILFKSGFEDTNIQIIGSLRHGNLTFINKRNKTERKSEILVVLSYDLYRSLEMIFKCVKAFSGTEDLSITFKPHPIINLEILMKFAGSLPKTFSFSSKSISTLFETANLVIYSDSNASVEAASLGIPFLHIKSDFTIDMNIFEDVELIPSVSSPQQIRIQSLKILNGEYPLFEEIQMYVKKIFSLVDENKILEIIS